MPPVENEHKRILEHSISPSCYATDFKNPWDAMKNRYQVLMTVCFVVLIFVFLDSENGKMPIGSASDLCLGTNKYSKRSLGYCGFVPASQQNQNHISESIPTPKSALSTSNM